MAEGNVGDYVQLLKNRFLECPICLEVFDDDDKHPRILPCLHTYCLQCLKKLAQGCNMTCSLCNKNYDIANGNLEIFPKDNTRRDLLDFVCAKLEPSKILCENCEDKQQAVYRCKECSQLLCQQCYDAHQTMKYSKDHNSFRLDSGEPTRENLHEFSRLDTCWVPGHEKESLKLFCQSQQCQKPICFVCAFSDHKNHTTTDVNSVYEEQKLAIKQAKKKLLERQSQTDAIEKQVQNALSELKDNTEKADNEVVTAFDECIQFLEHRKQELRDDIKNESEEKEKTLRYQVKELTTFSENVNSGCDFLQQYLSYKNAPKFLQVAPMITERFSNLQNQHIESKPQETPEIQFRKTNMGTEFQLHSLRMGELPMILPRIPKTPPPKLPETAEDEHLVEKSLDVNDDVFVNEEILIDQTGEQKSTEEKSEDVTQQNYHEITKSEPEEAISASVANTVQEIPVQVPSNPDVMEQAIPPVVAFPPVVPVVTEKVIVTDNTVVPEPITDEEKTKVTENITHVPDSVPPDVPTKVDNNLRKETKKQEDINSSSDKAETLQVQEEPHKKQVTKPTPHSTSRRKFSSKDDKKGERIRQRPKTPPMLPSSSTNGENHKHESRYKTTPVTWPSQVSQAPPPQLVTDPIALPDVIKNNTQSLPEVTSRELQQRKPVIPSSPNFHLDETTLPRDFCLSEDKRTLSNYHRGTHHRLLLHDQQPSTYVGVIASRGFKHPENVYFEVEITYSARRSGHPVVVFEMWFSKQEDIDAGQITDERKYKITLNNPSKVGEGTVSVSFNGVDMAIPRGKVTLGININASLGKIVLVENKKCTYIGKVEGIDFSQEVWPVFQISKDQTLNATMTLHSGNNLGAKIPFGLLRI